MATSTSPPPEASSSLFSKIKVGRGGAGNLYTVKDIQEIEARKAQDVEAQKASISSPTPITGAKPRIAPQFGRIGRGGAGNLFNAAIEAATLKKQKEEDDQEKLLQRPKPVTANSTNGDSNKKQQKMTVKYRVAVGNRTSSGRGGAGNIYEARLVEEQRKKDEAKKAEERRVKVREEAERETELLVGPPPRAFLGGREAESGKGKGKGKGKALSG